MDIAIIGGGFYGCYLAKHLSKNNKVFLYEKNSKLIQESGRNNQYRLHLGFHYPRSLKTIEQTIEGYNYFIGSSRNRKNLFSSCCRAYNVIKQKN